MTITATTTMMMMKRLRSVVTRHNRLEVTRRTLSTRGDACNEHVLSSPFGQIIQPGPCPPLYEFVTSSWQVHGGTLPNHHVAIFDGTTGHSRTLGDYHELAGKLAASLQTDFGISGPDDTVALLAPNHVDYVPVVLGISMTGAKCTPINPLYTADELQVVLTKSQSKVLIVHVNQLDKALSVVAKCPALQHVLVLTDNAVDAATPDASLPIGTTDIHAIRLQNTMPPPHTHASNVACAETATHPLILPYSSGTTGLPKGVLLTHENIVANLQQTHALEGPSLLTPGGSIISPLPFFHIYGLTVASLYFTWAGQTVLTSSGPFDFVNFLQMIAEHQPSRAYLVPPIVLALAKHPIVDQFDLSSVRTIISGAAPLSEEVERAVQARLPNCTIKQGYGMTESSPLAMLSPDGAGRSGSVGQLVPSTKAKVVDFETGQSLPPGQDGELLLQGPQVMMGYLDEPEQTAACLTPTTKWLHTGDVAHYDDDGYFYITDRAKELIKVRGMQVAPAELEALLL